ncbi:MAG TPA: SusC/RagA family TonB-linked outer membrane protein [Chryseolinea sp.]|nr:SusC/RagA family TonB-linked outer membrane protein [Chryseolinea sp.]
MKKCLPNIIVLLLLCGASAMAQTVTGRVTAGVDSSPLPGVSVLVKSTTTGTSTDADGRYTITVPDANAVLVVSFIGFATQEIQVGTRTVIDVSLAEDITQLNEVVVTALGITRETKTLVYATQSVKPSELTQVRDPNNVLSGLQGKVANAVITQGSGGVGSGARIVLRGNRSIQGSNNALIVVDGVPINNNTNGAASSDFGSVQGSDGASNINPDDIESMTVLRGASAAALYGSQAGNGVIVITTKKGSKEKIGVSINSGVTSERAFSLNKLQNTYGQGISGNIDASKGESWGAPMEGQSYVNALGQQDTYSAQPDNVKDFFRTGVGLNNSIGVTGGSEKMQTYLSYTNNKVKGIIPGNDLNRHTINLRLSNQFGKRFSTDAKVTYIAQQIDNRPRTGEENAPVSNIYQIPRSLSTDVAKNYEAPNALGVPTPTPWASTLSSIYQNPYWIINRTAINETRDRIMGYITAKFAITDWLSLQGRANLDRTIDRGDEAYSQGTILWSTVGGTYKKYTVENSQKWFDLMLEGSNKLTDDLKIDYRVGAILQDSRWSKTNNTANGLNVANRFSLNFASTPQFDQDATRTQTQSVFGQVNLAYKEAIFLDASLRSDWASPLPSPYQFNYPSVGVSAILTDLFTIPEAISFLKISGNYAVVGNGGRAYLRNNVYNYAQGAGHGFISRSTTQALPDLKYELVKNIEFGIDTKFLENRLGVTLTVYKSNSTNQLLKILAPVATGYIDKYINAGEIENKGLEVVLSGTPLDASSKLKWDIQFNMGMNRNKIVTLSPDLKQTPLADGFGRSATPLVKEGGSFGDLTSFKWKTDDNGNYVVTAAGVPVSTTGDQSYIGNFNPKATFGLTNTFNYDRFSLRILVDGRAGGVIVSGTEMNLSFSGIPEITEKYREGGWNLGGVDANGNPVDATITAQQFWQAASTKRYGTAEFFAYNATNFRVRELAFGYSIPVPESFFIKSAKISIVARNLFFLYRGSSIMDIPGLGKRKMDFDPDMALGNGNYQGVQYFTLPSTQSIGFNVMLNF